MSKRASMVGHHDVFDYWKNKVIFPDGSVEQCAFGGFDTVDVPISIVEDWGEPDCWGCRKPVKKVPNSEDLKEIWSTKETKSLLNRCHIIPKSLGGEKGAKNLFLMCLECHVLSPDTTNKRAFFRWVYDRRQKYIYGKMTIPYALSEVDKELSRRGLPPIAEFVKKIPEPTNTNPFTNLNEYLKVHAGFHGHRIVDSTWITALADWVISEFNSEMLK